jgi:7,8-dihydro-6-hydroxymethylpterin-pyrophosphokinase
MTNKDPASVGQQPESVYLGLGSNVGDRESNLREAIKRIEALGLEITRTSSIYETEPVGYTNQPWFLNQVIEVHVDLGVTTILETWSPSSSTRDRKDAATILETRSPSLSTRDRKDAADIADHMVSLSRQESGIPATFWILGLLEKLLEIEHEMGRERTIPNGPRAIDIDILIYGDVEGGFAITRNDPARPGTAGAVSPSLSLPHPRMHERRFVLEPLCEIAPDLVHPTLKKTCRELLASLEDASAVRFYQKS